MAKILVYQMWPISWDGGLEEMTEHLVRVKELGATHVWVSPLYPSPRADHGYDVADYCRIDRKFGTMKQFDVFVKTAHRLGLKVLMDLILNHTSTSHHWFTEKPEYYCWTNSPNSWQSLFGGSAWEYSKAQGMYYCHLFDKAQADLDWFPDGNISHDLVREFRYIVDFWMNGHAIDGFRLDVPQSINKNFANSELDLGEMLMGDAAVSVLNAVFSGQKKKPFLVMEILDPTFGELVKKYIDDTPVDYCINKMLKEERFKGWSEFYKAFRKSIKEPGFMLDLESHDAPRFTSISGMLPRQIAQVMFTSNVGAICLYQGQELGLKNPEDLTVDEMKALDAQSRIQLEAGVPEEKVKATSRANARVPLPLEEYDIQEKNRDSSLNWFKFYIQAWKKTRNQQ